MERGGITKCEQRTVYHDVNTRGGTAGRKGRNNDRPEKGDWRARRANVQKENLGEKDIEALSGVMRVT